MSAAPAGAAQVAPAGFAQVAAPARVAQVAAPGNTVTFIGDSVTAGFGYCGPAETAAGVQCRPNQEMANSWVVGKNSLKDCAPPDPPLNPTDACSNDNDKGAPWNAPPWSPGPDAPDVAYPYQIAASQSPDGGAAVSDWAVTGATPADWDPDGGIYGPQLKKLDDQYVVMTLGANPLLSYFTNIVFPVINRYDVVGECVGSTGYDEGGFFSKTYSGPISNAVGCLDRKWDRLHQTRHLVNVYKTLLTQNDHILILGYYTACSWSFGNWQPRANIARGPAAGDSCHSQSRQVSPHDTARVTQWEQAIAVATRLNQRIHHAVIEAQDWAKTQWPGTTRYQDLAWTRPDEAAWAQHQPHSPLGSWILRNDTWIHPSKAGAAQLAHTVTSAMCADFRHWCGATPHWG
jgi:hypothetical protein